jgi:serine/threonine protein kinase
MPRRRGIPMRHGPKTKVDVGTRVDGYRVERIVCRRPGLNTLAEAATLRGERTTLDVLAQPLKNDRELRRRVSRLVPLRRAVDHPNVLRLMRSVDGGQRLHMQAIPPGAGTLADLLAAGRLERTQALKILGQVAGALETARLKGLVHRALSPRSIVVQPGDEPMVFLTDFGIGAPRGRACELVCTAEEAAYRSPEEIRGEAPEPASNVYSLTSMLVECLTGSPAYPYERPLLKLHAHLTEPPPRPSERDPSLPAELDAVVASGMAKNPREREGSSASLVTAAAHALSLHVPIPVVREARKPAAPKPAPKPRPAPAAVRTTRPRSKPKPKPKPERRPDPHPARKKASGRPLLRRVPVWAALALTASAAAGFATGTAAMSEDRPPPAKAVSEPAPKQAEEPPVVTKAIDRLDARRVSLRKRLDGARTARAQAAAAAGLGSAYRRAEARIAKAASSHPERQLAAHLGDTRAAYMTLAGAAQRTNERRWRQARSAALQSERELELLLRTGSWN